MVSEINIVIEAFEEERTCVHSSYKVDGVGYTFTGVADDGDDILTPETDLSFWLRSFLISGVNHILNLENECPAEPVQAKFCLLIRRDMEVLSAKIGIAEVCFIQDGALCKIFYDMIVPTILN